MKSKQQKMNKNKQYNQHEKQQKTCYCVTTIAQKI